MLEATVKVAGVETRQLTLQTDQDILQRDWLQPHTVIGFANPATQTGDLGVILGVEADGTIRLASVEARKTRVYKLEELEGIRPLVVILGLPLDLAASVEEGAIYQASDGTVVLARGGRWVHPYTLQPVRLPALPELVLRFSPSLRA